MTKYMVLLATLLMAGAALAETNTIQGVWTTGPVLGQLGMVVTEKEFRTNGIVCTRVQFLQMTNVPPMVVTGSYSTADGKLTTVVRGGTTVTPYTLDGDALILKEERAKETRLTRKNE